MRAPLITFVLLMNCNVNPDLDQSGFTNYRDAIQLNVGNTWTYEVIEKRNDGTIIKHENEIIAIIDTINFNERKGYIMASNQQYFFERVVIDSSGYLKDYFNNIIIFADVDSDLIFSEDDYRYIMMTDIDSVITVPVGTFKTINYKQVLKKDSSACHFYANGIGLVKQVYKGSVGTKEHNLIDYQISQ